jgi:DNA polymerase
MQELEEARNLLKAGTYKVMPNKFDSISEVLSQLVRTAFVPEEGSRFIVVDFSAIEARIISWLAGQFWRMEVFKSHGMIYEASAARMFGVPMEEITKDSQLRQKGKIAELALGYQGSKGALVNMGALKMGLKEEELLGLVEAWRDSNSKIVRLWHDVEEAAIAAVWDRKSVQLEHGLEFSLEGGILFIKLPSGRRLSYINPRLEPDFNYKKYRLSYEGMDQTSKQWTRLDTYGGKLVENIVQAIARDCLAEAMLNLHMAGYKITFHVHDEVILEVPFSFGSIEEVLRILSKEPSWAKGLPLRAEGFEARYYRK